MGLITRHSGAPFADGEVLDAGPEGSPEGLEFDISAFYAEFNGNVDNVNLKDAADLSGTKVAAASLAAAKIANNAIDAAVLLDNSIEDAKVAADAVTAAKIAPNALTSEELAYNPIFETIDTEDFGEVISESIVTTVGSGAVLAVWLARLIHFPLNEGGGSVPDMQFRLKRGATVLQLAEPAIRQLGRNLGINAEQSICLAYADTSRPGGASVTYSIEAQQDEFPSDPDKSIIEEQRLYLLNWAA